MERDGLALTASKFLLQQLISQRPAFRSSYCRTASETMCYCRLSPGQYGEVSDVSCGAWETHCGLVGGGGGRQSGAAGFRMIALSTMLQVLHIVTLPIKSFGVKGEEEGNSQGRAL